MRLKIDGQAWNRGFDDGEHGLPLRQCPYAVDAPERWSWASGYVEGKAKRDGYAAAKPAPRPPENGATAAEPSAVPLRSTAPGPAAEDPGSGGVIIARRSGVKVPRRLTAYEARPSIAVLLSCRRE